MERNSAAESKRRNHVARSQEAAIRTTVVPGVCRCHDQSSHHSWLPSAADSVFAAIRGAGIMKLSEKKNGTAKYRVIALDPSVRGAARKVLTALVEIPGEELEPGPRGYRVQVIDYDASNQVLYRPVQSRPQDNVRLPKYPERDRAFHARNVYAIVMRVLARFERSLGRRATWSFLGHQLTVAPHAFLDLNAFYS